MTEKCGIESGRECIQSTRLALLEERVRGLEEGQDREEAFRKTYYADREDRIRRDTELEAKVNSIDSNVKALVERQAEEDQKPKRFLDDTKKQILFILLAAALGFVLAKIGL